MGKRYLIIRPDRVGDVLLTTPVGSALRSHDPSAYIAWLVRPYTAPLLEHNPHVNETIVDNGASVKTLALAIRSLRFDVAIVAYPRWRHVAALWRAGVPRRIGPASKLYSLLFTDQIWQHRSAGTKHEADYNLELLAPLNIPFKRFPTELYLTTEEKSQAKRTLEGHRISFRKPVVVIHPGSGGSSARWPLKRFMELGDRLQETGCDVVITGGPGEDYQYLMIDNMRRIPVFVAAGSVSLRELASIYAGADLVVSNSTGPLHLAVAVGVATVSIYSAIVTCHPRRWGPYPAYPEGNSLHQVAVAPDEGTPQVDIGKVSVEAVLKLCEARLAMKPPINASVG